MSDLIYAIGDVHGRDDLLERMHARIAADREHRQAGAAATIVHIGDYVDRGGNPLGVIDRIMHGVEGFGSVSLKGNHEAMMLDCLDTENTHVWSQWLQNGGTVTMDALGISSYRHGHCDSRALADALGPERTGWLRGLPLSHLTGRWLFVHAGIRPGVPLERQSEHDMLWIRSGFLDSDADHGPLVIHGHTPNREPEVRANRINIDTGASAYGTLTAVVLSEAEPRLLSVEGQPGRGP